MICPPLMAVRPVADLCPSMDESTHLWWLARCRQPTCKQPRQLRHAASVLQPTLGQTDGQITVSLNAPYGGGITSEQLSCNTVMVQGICVIVCV